MSLPVSGKMLLLAFHPKNQAGSPHSPLSPIPCYSLGLGVWKPKFKVWFRAPPLWFGITCGDQLIRCCAGHGATMVNEADTTLSSSYSQFPG